MNVADRWFLRLRRRDPVFDASHLSQNRRRRYRDTEMAEKVFDHIVEQAIGCGLVVGPVLYTDSTHLAANVNNNRFDKAVAAKLRADYWETPDAAVEADRAAHGKPPLQPRERRPAEKETKISRIEPDGGHMVRDSKPKGFVSPDHRTVDGKLGIITCSFDTPPKPGVMRKKVVTCLPAVDGYGHPEGQVLANFTTDRTATATTSASPTAAALTHCSLRAPPSPRPSASSPAMSGRTPGSAATPTV